MTKLSEAITESEVVRKYMNNAEATICGEFHLGKWPECEHRQHQVYWDTLAALARIVRAVDAETE